MVESRLPWWLVLLLGVWVAGLSVWSWPRAQRQIRWGAGLLSLVYLALLFTALGGDPRTIPSVGVVSRGTVTVSWGFVVSSAVAVLAGVFLLGRPAGRGPWAWFVVLTMANAASCFVWGAAAVGAVLLAVSVVIGLVLAPSPKSGLALLAGLLSGRTPPGRDVGLSEEPDFKMAHGAELLPAPQSASTSTGLACATGFVLALLLVGTLRYTVRVETSRATASHRFSAIPSVDQIRSALETDAAFDSTAGPFELAMGRRADVLVLLAVLAFLVLAMHNPSRSVLKVSKLEEGHSCPSDLGMEERTGKSAHPPNLFGDGISPHGGPS